MLTLNNIDDFTNDIGIIGGDTTPGAEVTVTITDSSGTEYTATFTFTGTSWSFSLGDFSDSGGATFFPMDGEEYTISCYGVFRL